MTPYRDSLLLAVHDVLLSGGFTELSTPLTIAGVPLEVPRAYVAGAGFLDLVVVVDCLDATVSRIERVYWLIERIARALDQASSRRPLTVVVMHDPSGAAIPMERFLRLARVLLVADLDTLAVDLAPILPLILEPGTAQATDPISELLDKYGRRGEWAYRLIRASEKGPGAVEAALTRWIDESFLDDAKVADDA